ncbi:MAG: Trk system potassium transporter TrkA [Myxococcota bacterium]
MASTPEMHVVIIGLGEVGRQLIRALEPEGHDIVAIDLSSTVTADVEQKFDVQTNTGYGASEKLLEDVGVARADLFVAVTDHDEVNLISALMAKDLGARQVVARTQGEAFAVNRQGIRHNFLGIDVVINPSVLVSQELVKVARSHGAVEVIDLSQDRIELVQVSVPEKSKFIHRPLSSLPLVDVLVAAVVRNGELFVPGGADNLLPEDRLYLVGRPADLPAAEDLFTVRRQAKRACIAGGGLTGDMVAQSLIEDGVQVTIIESDPQRREELAGRDEQKATIVGGDATDRDLLIEEEIGSYELFAAATSSDELNLMAALLAKRMGVQRVAAVVHKPSSMDIYRQLGIDIVVSPRAVASDRILALSRKSQTRSLTKLAGGQAEVLELDAMHGCRAVGLPLRQLNLPRGSLVCAIVHDDQVIIPGGNAVIEAGDSVIVLVSRGARSTVERLFRPGLL